MPTKPWFRPINDLTDPSLHTWVFDIGGVRYQLEPQKNKKPVRQSIIPRFKRLPWTTPEGLKQLDFKAFIKFVSHHQQLKEPSASRSKSKSTRPQPPIHPGWDITSPPPFGCEWLVYRRPEGYGKSSLVFNLIAKERTVIFCSKSNKQLIEHEENFKRRWKHLRIHRHVSKAQHLSEFVQALCGQEFKLSTHPSISPYAQELVDVQQSLDRLTELVGNSATEIFKNEYEDWKAPEIDGKDFDIILITLTAFHVLCTGYRKTWWEHLNLSMKVWPEANADGYAAPFPELEIRQRGNYSLSIPTSVYVDYEDDDLKRYTIDRTEELCGPFLNYDWTPDPKGKYVRFIRDPNDDGSRTSPTPKVVIIVDDPDRTDFDWMRRIDGEDDAAELYSLTNKKEKHTHIIANRWEEYFEQRQERATFGFGIQRGVRRTRPMVIIFTTELVTAKFACKTFENLHIQQETRRGIRHDRHYYVEIGGEQVKVELEPVYRPFKYVLSDYSPVSDVAHVTLLFTPLVRKRNHAMLIPIVQELRDKFPSENLNFIANGLGCEWNLSNVRGINSMSEAASIIKLSVLHPHASLDLMVHFKDEQPRDIVLQLVADQANQAIGRNQGNRFNGYPTIVLCDPKYMGIERLLRYKLTPWSSEHAKGKFEYVSFTEQPIEKWLKYRLATARWFATSNIAEQYVSTASAKQQAIYWKWREAIT
jgi:hypothetical protein